MKFRISAAALATCLAASCGSSEPIVPSETIVVDLPPPIEESDSTYRGTYFYNSEAAHITPEGLDERWCTYGDMSKAELPPNHPNGPWGLSDVSVRGRLGPRGRYGGLGACDHILYVTEVLEVSNMRGPDGKAP